MKRYASAVAIWAISTVFMVTLSAPSQAKDLPETAKNEKQHEFKDLNDRFSYAYGADLAEKLKAEGIDLNVDLMARAMRDVFAGGDRKMSTDEVVATIHVFRGVHQKKKEAEWEAAGKENKKEGKKFLAENAKKEGVLVTKSGLQYKVITEGSDGPKPKEDDLVTVHYRGSLLDGSEFDNTYQRNEPFSSTVERLIPGWAEALQMMSEGAKWEIYIPADLAYGEDGSDPFIGPNAVLIFEVELLEIEKE